MKDKKPDKLAQLSKSARKPRPVKDHDSKEVKKSIGEKYAAEAPTMTPTESSGKD